MPNKCINGPSESDSSETGVNGFLTFSLVTFYKAPASDVQLCVLDGKAVGGILEVRVASLNSPLVW